ncbi:MAG: prolyl oligopeptidase family serine peptidase [Planctomycetes bacterium]|nr:prolyl oligopeptidase family serine peptidase [Planctomycetota bacterium]
MMKALAIAVLLACGSAQDEGQAREFKSAAGAKLPYRIFKPASFDEKMNYPLVIFLHGAGERGDDNKAQTKHGVKCFLQGQAKHPCFIVAPQCPSKAQWVNTPWGDLKHTIPAQPSEPMQGAIELIAALQKEFPSIDPKRLYVTGLSMGGFGTWDLITRMPRTFAAAVPVCGGADDAKAAAIAKVPVWVFHGGADDVVKTVRSRNIVAALKAAGGSPRYTEFPGVGHGCWDQAYGEADLLPWLFSQKLP